MTLNETLQQIKSASLAKIPAEAARIMSRATAQLENSGIIKTALGSGQPPPEFELPDCLGNSYNSSALLANGPLILHFYRGSW